MIVSGSLDRRLTHHQPPKSALTELLLRAQNRMPAREPSRLSLHAVKLWLDPRSFKAATALRQNPFLAPCAAGVMIERMCAASPK